MYSAKSSLRILAGIGLSIAALVLVVVGTVHFTINRSPAVIMSAMFAVVVVGALAMIFIIQAVSSPKEEQLTTTLPPAATFVHFHRKKVYPWVRVLLIFLAGCGALGWVIPGDAKYILLSFGGITLLLTLVLVPVMYVTARRFDVSLSALEFAPWVHWQYTAEQWQQWSDVQVARSNVAPQALRKRLLKAAPEVYFGHDGVFCDGIYTNWLTLNTYLLAATVDDRPPRSLLFSFEKIVPAMYGQNPVTAIQQSVLIPTGVESDLARLQRELILRCPKAKIALA